MIEFIIFLMLMILLVALTFKLNDLPIPFQGIVLTILFSLPVTILFTIFFRFPAPFTGMVGPVDAVEIMSDITDLGEVLIAATFLWLLHLVLGGFIVLSIFGAISGMLANQKYPNSMKKRRKFLIFLSVISCVIPILILSTSDYIIGPW
jgi:hypothetical protein